MFKLAERIANEQKRNSELLSSIRKFKKTLPEGNVQMCKKNGKEYYLLCKQSGKKQSRKYLGRNDMQLVSDLLLKSYYSHLNVLLEANKRAFSVFLKNYTANPEQAVLNKMPEWKRAVLKPLVNKNAAYIESWLAEEYEKNTYPNEERSIFTAKGEAVRSIQEREIADSLSRAGIPYRIDCVVLLPDGRKIYADFVILHPQTLEIYYWEHFGRLDDPAYNARNHDRIAAYASAGIIIGDKLIVTGSTWKHVFSSKAIEGIIERYFL